MTTDRCEISVVLCSHNGTQYLKEQLLSILRQTYLPSELIFSDDDSTDGTLQFARDVIYRAQQFNPILKQIKYTFISNVPALGVTKNFENALRAATCDLIALSDQDDVWNPNRLAQIANLFSADPEVVLLHSDAELIDSQNQYLKCNLFEALRVSSSEKELINSGRGFQVLLRRNIVTGATTVFKKSLLKSAFPFPPELLHDEWLALVASFTGKISLVEEPLISYRQHGNNQVGVRKLGLKHFIGRIVFPRTERNKILLARARAIREHSFFDLSRDQRAHFLVTQKLTHETVRSHYPSSRIRRVRPVLRELMTGRYTSFGLGAQDVLRDLIQPV